MRKILIYFVILCILIFSVSCQEKKKDTITENNNVDNQDKNDTNNILKAIPEVEIDEYARGISSYSPSPYSQRIGC